MCTCFYLALVIQVPKSFMILLPLHVLWEVANQQLLEKPCSEPSCYCVGFCGMYVFPSISIMSSPPYPCSLLIIGNIWTPNVLFHFYFLKLSFENFCVFLKHWHSFSWDVPLLWWFLCATGFSAWAWLTWV